MGGTPASSQSDSKMSRGKKNITEWYFICSCFFYYYSKVMFLCSWHVNSNSKPLWRSDLYMKETVESQSHFFQSNHKISSYYLFDRRWFSGQTRFITKPFCVVALYQMTVKLAKNLCVAESREWVIFWERITGDNSVNMAVGIHCACPQFTCVTGVSLLYPEVHNCMLISFWVVIKPDFPQIQLVCFTILTKYMKKLTFL